VCTLALPSINTGYSKPSGPASRALVAWGCSRAPRMWWGDLTAAAEGAFPHTRLWGVLCSGTGGGGETSQQQQGGAASHALVGGALQRHRRAPHSSSRGDFMMSYLNQNLLGAFHGCMCRWKAGRMYAMVARTQGSTSTCSKCIALASFVPLQ
jgi:hypothetical protein